MQENHVAHRRLDSWKEIAAYLHRDTRTAIRWGKERGLPVYRVPGGKRQAVFAYAHELDAWLKQGESTFQPGQLEDKAGTSTTNAEISPARGTSPSSIRPHWSKYLIVFIAVGAVVSVFWGLKLFSHVSNTTVPIVRIGFTQTAVQAFGDAGQLIWTHTYSKILDIDPTDDLRPLANMARFVDLKGDGERAVLVMVPLRIGPNPSEGIQMEVDCFSSTGQLLWSYVPQRKFGFGNYELEGPWGIRDIFVSAHGARPAIWVSMKHNPWGTAFVAQLDPSTGKDSVRFVNSGPIYTLNEAVISGKPYLLAGGFDSEYSAGIFAVIDEDTPFAVSPQTAGTRHKCVSCPEGAPDYYFVFPRSEINLLENQWEDPIFFTSVHGEEIEIVRVELIQNGPDAPAQLDKVRTVYAFHAWPTVAPYSFRFDTGYDLLHGELERKHKLNHSLDDCPERRHPQPVKVWTPSTGWAKIDLNPIRAVD
jgi:hypothetical protein